MEQRQLGQSGLYVPALGLGTGTFGGQGPLFSAWGDSGVEHARRMIAICHDAGLNLFDSADVYSDGASEAVLDDASAVMPPYPYYPYWNGQFSELAPSAVRSSVQKL